MAEPHARRARSLREHVASVLADRTRVSAGQEAGVQFSRNFFLQACPGSGKTRTVGLRMAWASVDGRGRAIAATSYTNAAVAEIQRAAADAGVPVAPPHWVGTMHSFLITYVLQPFAPLALGTDRLPRIVAQPFQQPPTNTIRYDRHKPPVSPWDFEYAADGSVEHNPIGFRRLSNAAVQALQEPLKQAKAQLARRGYVSQADALFYAMRLLEDHPELAAAVAARFDELIVDEVQDTNPTQLRCVELLCASGELRSLVLCGDLDQAIYSFIGADPTACVGFVSAQNLEILTLTENYRSSQAICDVVPAFSIQPRPNVARGPNMAFGVEPELLRFHPQRCSEVVDLFRSRLELIGVEPAGAVVLARSHEFKTALNGNETLRTPRLLELLGRASARYRADGSLPGVTVRAIDNLLAHIAFEDAVTALEEPGHATMVREATMKVLEGAPDFELSLDEWIAQTQGVVRDALGPLEPLHKRVGDRIRRFNGCDRFTASRVFGGARVDVLEAEVIHRVKGESHDGVLLVAEPAGTRDHARLWTEALDSGQVTEEVRVAYVALTRAQRYCAVGLPDGCPDEIVRRFELAGFRAVEDPTAIPARKPHVDGLRP